METPAGSAVSPAAAAAASRTTKNVALCGARLGDGEGGRAGQQRWSHCKRLSRAGADGEVVWGSQSVCVRERERERHTHTHTHTHRVRQRLDEEMGWMMRVSKELARVMGCRGQ